ncbi:MAG: hypothetical protein CVU39_13220 [Chloroflexi bacterium HGW-Chloroflexi-10]|nr:MAG: hypothetical protein CVU39_13220 [Chloroflexi bacterium HGW-Chloroflexi-10]
MTDKVDLNGLITNDKICMVRKGELKLNHWHRLLRLQKDQANKYSTQKEIECGGKDATTMASPTDGAGVRGRAKAVEPSLSAGTGDYPVDRRESGETNCGGEPCE